MLLLDNTHSYYGRRGVKFKRLISYWCHSFFSLFSKLHEQNAATNTTIVRDVTPLFLAGIYRRFGETNWPQFPFCSLFVSCRLFWFDPKYEDNTFPPNVIRLVPDFTASHPRILRCLYSPPREPQIQNTMYLCPWWQPNSGDGLRLTC